MERERHSRYLCQDETRLGLKTIAGRLITATGVKPLGLSQWQRDNFYLYGVVEPLSGYSFFYEFSHLDSDCFQRFLQLLSAQLGDDVGVIQFDRGSFHRAEALDWPENIIPIFQPSHSPELNPTHAILGVSQSQAAMGKLQNSRATAAEVSFCARSDYT